MYRHSVLFPGVVSPARTGSPQVPNRHSHAMKHPQKKFSELERIVVFVRCIVSLSSKPFAIAIDNQNSELKNKLACFYKTFCIKPIPFLISILSRKTTSAFGLGTPRRLAARWHLAAALNISFAHCF